MDEVTQNVNNHFNYNNPGTNNTYSNNNNISGHNINVKIDNGGLKGSGLGHKIVGFWESWSSYRNGDQKFEWKHFDAMIFSHLVYTFFGVSADGEILHNDKFLNLEMEGGMIPKFIGLKAKNPNIKLMASIGGCGQETSDHFKIISSTKTNRETFAISALKFLKEYGFDGLDIYWLLEPSDRDNLVLLLECLKSLFDENGYVLSIAVKPTSYDKERYDVKRIAKNVDFINLLSFNLYGSWDGVTGCAGGLYVGSDRNPILNADACVRFWRSSGSPESKLVLGIQTYGTTFKLADPTVNGINAPIIGVGDPGLSSNISGKLSRSEILNSSWVHRKSEGQLVSYAFKGDQWVSFEDEESVKEKAKYVKKLNLGGVAFHSIDFDDFNGSVCGECYPLVKAAFTEFSQ